MRVNKKGVTELLMLFELVIAAIVIIGMISIAKNSVSGAKVSEKFLVKDAALMVDTMHALPGDASVSYETTKVPEQANIFVSGGNVKIGPESDFTGINSINTPYRESDGIAIAENRVSLEPEKSNLIIFSKKETTISMKIGG